MQSSNIPTKTPVVWASSAGGSYINTIPNTSQIGVINGAASYPDGFPPNTFLATTSGGIPPSGKDMNGILNALSAWVQWSQASGPVSFDASFCSSIGGYPIGATLLSTVTPGIVWFNTAENNTSNPDSGGSNWRSWGPSIFPAGTTMAFFNATAPTGWVQNTTYDDCTIRVVRGAGGTASMSGQYFSNATASGTVDGHALAWNEMPVHAHGVNDPTHGHLINDPTHVHGVTDPTHHHAIHDAVSGTTVGGASMASGYVGGSTSSSSVATGISIQGAGTGISNQTSYTGITIQDAGSGSAHSHTFTSSALNLRHIDMILATKS